MNNVVIVGGSIGGVRTAQRLRAMGYDGAVTIVEAEPRLPYDRPPLSKSVLSDPHCTPPTLLTAAQADAMGVELRIGTAATGVDLRGRLLRLADGDALTWTDGLVIASGVRARRSPWSSLPGVHHLRNWNDAVAVREALRSSETIAVIGAGFIGAEVASAARERRLNVHLIDIAEVPMTRHLGAEIGRMFVELHTRHGVDTHFGHSVHEVSATKDGLSVVIDDGTAIEVDRAIVGLGVELNIEWLADSGLTLDNGVVCDEYCRADIDASVYAVGDVTSWWHPGRDQRVRTEHWTNAVEQAAVVAHNISRPTDLMTHHSFGYVWSNQYDWKVQIAGTPSDGAAHEVIGDHPTQQFTALYTDTRGALCGTVAVNWPQLTVRARRALSSTDRDPATLRKFAMAAGAPTEVGPRLIS